MRRALLLAAAVLTIIAVPSARAQTSSGALEGTVRDASSGVLSGASVAVSGNRLIGGERRVQTDASGHFRVTELPPGLYAIWVSHPGFSAVRRDAIELPAGGTVIIDLTLAVGPVSDTVRIVVPSPMVDVTSAAPNQSIGETFLRELPTTRVSASLINLVPGVANDVAFGGTAGSNAIAADGLDITETARQEVWLRFDQNWVQEVQVASLGAGASAGGFTGLSANLVLKSGSNTLSGLGELRLARPSWVSSNTGRLSANQRSALSPRRIDQMWDASAQAGFPILRDRLWVFTGFRHSTLDDRPFGFSGSAVSQTDDSLYLLKLSSAPASRVRLEGFVQAGRYRKAAANLGYSFDDTALADETKPETSWNLRATWTPFERTLLEARYGGFSGSSNIVAHPPNTCSGPPAHYELTTGRWSGNFYECWQTSQRRQNGSLALTRTLAALAGTHEFKAGVEFDRTHRVDAYNYTGGLYFQDNGGAPSGAVLWPGGSETSDTGRTGVYVSDRWQVARRSTLFPGVRVDLGDGSIPGHKGIFATAAVSPRIGAAFDVGADHRTVLRAHFGRYVDPVFAQRVADADSSNWPALVLAQVVGPNQFVELFRSGGGHGGYEIDPDIRHSHVDEVIVGAERQIAPRVSVQLQYIRRRFGDFMGLVNPGSQYSPVTRTDPGPDGVAGTADDGGPLTVYALQGSDGSPWLYTNPPGASRRYDAAQVVVRSHGTRFAQFQASYTWSRSQGNVGNQAGTNAGLGDIGSPGNYNNPNLLINAYGRLFYDPTHELKLLGTSHLPLWGGLNVSAVYRYVTGNPWCRLVWATGLPQGWSRVRVEPRGARRLDATNILDLRIEQALRVPGRAKVSLLVEALNLANFGAGTSVTEMSGPNFGWPQTWTDPRIARLGLRYAF